MGQAPLGTNTTVLPWARAGASRDTKASRGHSSGHTTASTPSGSRSRSTGPLSSATCRDRKEVKGRAGESDYPPPNFSITSPFSSLIPSSRLHNSSNHNNVDTSAV